MKPLVVLVTDPRYEASRVAAVVGAAAGALGAGRLAVLLRDKRDVDVTRSARALRDVTSRHAALLVIGDRPQLACDVGADGTHVPGGASIARAREIVGPRAFVSAAAHDDDDVVRASREGADAVLVSPIFASPGKGVPRGIDAIEAARAAAPALRIYALGGVDAWNASSCVAAGAHGVAVVRALLDAADPARVARALGRHFGLTAAARWC